MDASSSAVSKIRPVRIDVGNCPISFDLFRLWSREVLTASGYNPSDIHVIFPREQLDALAEKTVFSAPKFDIPDPVNTIMEMPYVADTDLRSDVILFKDEAGNLLGRIKNLGTPSTERARALESLWVAIKELNADGTGYTPKLAEAVARLRKLEAGS